MLRDFGLVTLIDLSVSLLGVLVALPAGARARRRRPQRAARRAPGLRDGLAALRSGGLRRRGGPAAATSTGSPGPGSRP